MTIPVSCPCGKQFRAQPEWAGRRVQCPGCGQTLEVPVGAPASPTSPATPSPSTPSPDATPHGRGERPLDFAKSCQQCGLPLSPGAVLCVNCGFDLRTGKQLATESADAVIERFPYFGWMEHLPGVLTLVLSICFHRRFSIARGNGGAVQLIASLRFLGMPMSSRTVELSHYDRVLTDYRSTADGDSAFDGGYDEVHIIRLASGHEGGRVSFGFWNRDTFSAVIDLIRNAQPMELNRA